MTEKVDKQQKTEASSKPQVMALDDSLDDFTTLNTATLTPQDVLRLQASYGNQRVQRFLSPSANFAKATNNLPPIAGLTQTSPIQREPSGQGWFGGIIDAISGGETSQDEADHETVRKKVDKYIKSSRYDKAIQTVIKGYAMSTEGATDISYDADLEKFGNTHQSSPTEIFVTIGPTAFETFERLVHVIAHELEHVRLLRDGVTDKHIQEFLAESVEILSEGMLAEELPRFVMNAHRALKHWRLMTPEDKGVHWQRFETVRAKVVDRIQNDEMGSILYHDVVVAYQDETKP